MALNFKFDEPILTATPKGSSDCWVAVHKYLLLCTLMELIFLPFRKCSENLIKLLAGSAKIGDLCVHTAPRSRLLCLLHLLSIIDHPAMSSRRIVSGGNARIVVQQVISSGPSSFVQFCDANASFVDKTLAIEAFPREPGSHHLILRPRRCGKSYTLSMIRLSSFFIKYLCLLMPSASESFCSDRLDANHSAPET